MELRTLRNLRSFYPKSLTSSTKEGNPSSSIPAQPLFNEKVAFPSLKSFTIWRLKSIIEIWDNQSESFSQLRTLNVHYCDNLRNVFSLSNVKNLMLLQEVKISGCPEMEEILATGETTTKNGQEGESNNAIITFPQLKTLSLDELPNLKSFCSSRFKKEDEEIMKDKDILQVQPLFNHKVALPSLESFTIRSLDSIIEIWDNQSEFFSQLRTLHVYGLRNLKCFYSSRFKKEDEEIVKDKDILQAQPLVNHKVGFPVLEELHLTHCNNVTIDLEGLNVGKQQVEVQLPLRVLHLAALPKLNCIWNKDPKGIVSFQSLKTVIIQKCGLLKSLCTSSVARTLEQLQLLVIISCTLMEELVAKEESGEVTDEIIFPQLKFLILVNLRNLTCFCRANYAFNMPSLRRAELVNCPRMETFTFEQLRIKEYADENQWVEEKELYGYIRRQGKEPLTLTDGNNDDISSSDSDSRDNEYDCYITTVWNDDYDDDDDDEMMLVNDNIDDISDNE
ncbi:hypothetical protein F0562_011091 [Nyssa sinensis]|uniref:Disease resistance protein At4g27190-like leucine-rich repeats domain-containing protein n=1 Tax=Nyssa sinensis TaxID=561372 RepID=A0A5J5A3U8_9ASTE|nr:hypothetical protein F0562_011091 [Nyssa sinensis]